MQPAIERMSGSRKSRGLSNPSSARMAVCTRRPGAGCPGTRRRRCRWERRAAAAAPSRARGGRGSRRPSRATPCRPDAAGEQPDAGEQDERVARRRRQHVREHVLPQPLGACDGRDRQRAEREQTARATARRDEQPRRRGGERPPAARRRPRVSPIEADLVDEAARRGPLAGDLGERDRVDLQGPKPATSGCTARPASPGTRSWPRRRSAAPRRSRGTRGSARPRRGSARASRPRRPTRSPACRRLRNVGSTTLMAFAHFSCSGPPAPLASARRSTSCRRRCRRCRPRCRAPRRGRRRWPAGEVGLDAAQPRLGLLLAVVARYAAMSAVLYGCCPERMQTCPSTSGRRAPRR
jgi:hypothetical protein